jgi:monoterpene epsilon-lactone hydrolase
MPPSLTHRALAGVLSLTHRRRMPHDDAGMVAELTEATLRPRSFAPPRSLDKRVTLTVAGDRGWRVYELAPRTAAAPARRIVYFHGGGYVGEIDPGHWRFCARLATLVPARVTVPIYPVAPGSTAEMTVPTAAAVTRDVVTEAGDPALVTLMGDSAGGGLALATAQALRDEGIGGIPLVLVAPWLDATMTDPRIDVGRTRDPILSVPRLVRAGELYAGDLPPADPRVSPIHGSLAGLGRITIYVGTRDLLVWDARRLRELAAAAGVPVDLHEADGLVHVWPLLPLPEARRIRPAIAAAVRRR